MGKKFKRDLSSLGDIFEFIDEFSVKTGLDESVVFTMNLVVEELFTNMVKYTSGNTNKILLELKKEENNLIIHLTDFDVDPFDITETAEVDTKQSLEERRVGGLGIHLVKEMMDKIEYEYKDRQSKIILIKHLEN
ncbi:MAG: ATP-binding protein [Caldithrix sp.]|nr:MAG: ATP-binding protein [Caldithrix sp.]TDI92873.1 MAG: ATP-binding protein [Caldithrix sp.]